MFLGSRWWRTCILWLFAVAYDNNSVIYLEFKCAVQNREKLCGRFADAPSTGVILMKGGEQKFRYDTDVEVVFRQESNFFVCFRTHNSNS
jgi:hypothetical protein